MMKKGSVIIVRIIKKKSTRSLDELKALVEPYRSKDGSPDCLVPFSGGRDSMYVMHVIKKELGLNPNSIYL